MCGCESWIIKKAEHWRIDAFELWCWRRFLRVPLTARRSILKEINPEYTLEELMLKLKHQHLATWYKELTHWKRPWCWERLRARGEGDNRGWDRGRHHRLNGHKFEQTQGDSEGWWNLAAAIHRIAKSQTGFSDWTTTRSRNNKDGGDRTIKGLISNFFYGNCQGLS